MICSYIGCNRLATWFNEYSTPFHIRTLDEVNVIPTYRMPICHVHKCKDSQPFESLEMRDSDDVFPVVIKPHDYQACKHIQTEIDEDLRTISCVKCGEKLDPVEVLIQVAKSGRTKNYKVNAIAEANRKAKQKYERQKNRHKP
jgi:hypothetical protein